MTPSVVARGDTNLSDASGRAPDTSLYFETMDHMGLCVTCVAGLGFAGRLTVLICLYAGGMARLS